MILDNTTTTLILQAASDPGVAVPFGVSFYEQIQAMTLQANSSPATWPNPQKNLGQLASGGTTAVTGLTAPDTGRRRIVHHVWLRNPSAGNITYKVILEDTANTPTQVELRFTLATGDMLFYDGGPDGGTWQAMNSSGEIKTVGSTGAAGPTGGTGPTGPAVFLLGDAGEDGEPGAPGREGAAGSAGSAGATGATGPSGPAIFLLGDEGEEGQIGPPGPASGGVTDHGALSGLTDDDHSQYPLGAGRSGGQTITGGTGSGDDITLRSTTHATKGDIKLADQGGDVVVGGGSTASAIKLLEPSGGGSSGLSLKAQAMTGDATMLLPDGISLAYRALGLLDATGTLGWVTGLVQHVYTFTGAVATGTTVLPNDDTIPQNTEGDEYMTLAITPKNTANILIIEALGVFASTLGANFGMALFQDTTADALAAVAVHTQASAVRRTIPLCWVMVAGTTSATTFKIRAGAHAANTTTFNGVASARIYGGVMGSYIRITEISP